MTSFCKNIPPDKCDPYVDCQAVRLQEGDYAAFPELTCNAELLAGEEAAVERAAGRGETWYEWLVARLLYTSPTVRTYDLAVPGQQAVARFGGLAGMTTLDSVLLAALESDVPQVMRELCLTLDNFWLPAHLLDLLQHAGALGQQVLHLHLAPAPGTCTWHLHLHLHLAPAGVVLPTTLQFASILPVTQVTQEAAGYSNLP